MAVYSVLGPGGYPRPPYDTTLFGTKVPTVPGRVYTQTFSVLGPQGVPRPPYSTALFATKVPAVFVQPAGVDTSDGFSGAADPIFFDWWRKRAEDERAKLEFVQEELEEAAPALRVETIAAVEAATSIHEIQSLNLLKYERDILRAAIAEYQAMIDQDEEEAEFLLLN